MKLIKWPEDKSVQRTPLDGSGAHNYHWCPACEKLHVIPDETGRRWQRSGPDEAPTYCPSFLQYDAHPNGNCHYNITDGMLQFHPDSWHKRNDLVRMLDIPEATVARLTDAIFER